MEIKKVISFIKSTIENFEEDYFKKHLEEIIELLEEISREGEKFEEFEECKLFKKMWENFKEEYKHKPITREWYKNGVCKPQRFIGKMMDEFEQKYFPKSKSRWHKINNTIYNLNTIGGKVDIKELTSLLIELRDEEL